VQVLVLLLPIRVGDADALGSGLVQPLPAEIVDHQAPFGRQELGHLVEGDCEVGDVVERKLRDDGVERVGFVEILDCHTPKDRPGRGFGIDTEHVVAGLGQRD
jgi:hypothetical protein